MITLFFIWQSNCNLILLYFIYKIITETLITIVSSVSIRHKLSNSNRATYEDSSNFLYRRNAHCNENLGRKSYRQKPSLPRNCWLLLPVIDKNPAFTPS